MILGRCAPYERTSTVGFEIQSGHRFVPDGPATDLYISQTCGVVRAQPKLSAFAKEGEKRSGCHLGVPQVDEAISVIDEQLAVRVHWRRLGKICREAFVKLTLESQI